MTTLPRLVATLAAAGLIATAAPGAPPRVLQPFTGITLVERTASTPRPVRMHIAQIDTRAPGIRFRVSPPAGGRETIHQTTLDFLRNEGAQLAVNGHFFLPFPSADTEAWVIGLAASEGRIYSAFESPEQDYALVADAPALDDRPY